MIKKYKTKNIHEFFKFLLKNYPKFVINSAFDESTITFEFIDKKRGLSFVCKHISEKPDHMEQVFTLMLDDDNLSADIPCLIALYLMEVDKSPLFYINLNFEDPITYLNIKISHFPIN